MKKIVIFVVVFFLFFAAASRVMAQTPDASLDSDTNGPSDVVLTPSGTTFANGAADGQCTVSGASCTTANKIPGICTDNGTGAGVCAAINTAIDPLFDTGCKPNEICHIPPEKINRVLDGGQTESKVYPFNPVGSIWSYVQTWIGQVKPDKAYHYGTDLLAKFGYQVQDASYNDLTPATLQNLTLHDYQPKRYCTTSIMCIYNPFSQELMYQFKTSETWCTEDPPGRKQLIEGTRRLASYTTNYTTNTDYRLPNTVVKKANHLAAM